MLFYDFLSFWCVTYTSCLFSLDVGNWARENKDFLPSNIFLLHLFRAAADGDSGPSRCLPQKTAKRPLQLRGCAHPERLRKLRIYFMDELKCVTAGMRRLCSPPVQNQQQLTAQIYFWASVAVLKKKKKTLCLSSRHNNSSDGGSFFCKLWFIFFLRNITWNQTSLGELGRDQSSQKHLQRQGSPASAEKPRKQNPGPLLDIPESEPLMVAKREINVA